MEAAKEAALWWSPVNLHCVVVAFNDDIKMWSRQEGKKEQSSARFFGSVVSSGRYNNDESWRHDGDEEIARQRFAFDLHGCRFTEVRDRRLSKISLGLLRQSRRARRRPASVGEESRGREEGDGFLAASLGFADGAQKGVWAFSNK